MPRQRARAVTGWELVVIVAVVKPEAAVLFWRKFSAWLRLVEKDELDVYVLVVVG